MSPVPMRVRRTLTAAAAVASISVLAACGAEQQTGGGSTAGTDSGAPADQWTVELKDGSTFRLADDIREKVENNETINYLFSYQSSSIQGFSEQYKAGFERTQPDALAVYPEMQFKAVAPSENPGDVPKQISQIQAQVNAGQVDCVAINPLTDTGYTQITNELLAQGIPVFTIGITTRGNELTNFTQVPLKEGAQSADETLKFMRDNDLDFKVFAVSGGEPTLAWAKERMKGFQERIMEEIPDAEFVTTWDNPLAVTYDAAQSLDAYRAFLRGKGSDVDVIQNVDIGAGYAAQAISEAGREGETFSLGWNVTPEQIEAIKAGTQIALFDQKWWEQAGFGAKACAEFLKNGKVLPNTQELQVVTKANVNDALAELDEILGQ
ncbi:MAG TPA: sugar ABC transporter substrate-binding protein [Capillimicrobium sp.]